ncbi:RNA-binding protein squid-like isoform X5 [Neocloeon triangulifer]|uniref:RNA-binding protein squid-like isoform X5 n=1 Tax=Neocloeon triangulifer TaxID=2078957 RepID=UPI00286F4AA9|nr:RNA-binding protein squid-like isoform X5 [Neocloeon triangulifer]
MADQDYDASGNGDFQEDMGGECDNLESEDALLNGAENGGGETQLQQQGESSGSGRDDDRKLFVGGLSWETTDKELREHFSKFGDIESINVKTDPNTGRSRGFAFIVFGTAEGLEKALNAGDHVINNKKVDPKKAKARHGKIFVGGLPTELSDEDIKSFFSAFGTIMEVEMPFDKIKNQRKGFCFITFESDQVVQELLKTPKQTINGKEVDVKKATPRPENMGGMRGGRGGRGGPRGGRGGRGGRGRGGGGFGGSQNNYNNGWSYGEGNDGGYGGGYDYYGSGYGNYGGYGGGYDYTGYNYGNYEQS